MTETAYELKVNQRICRGLSEQDQNRVISEINERQNRGADLKTYAWVSVVVPTAAIVIFCCFSSTALFVLLFVIQKYYNTNPEEFSSLGRRMDPDIEPQSHSEREDPESKQRYTPYKSDERRAHEYSATSD